MSGVAKPVLRLRERQVAIGGTPLVMGILNATPDSFSDAPAERDPGTRDDRGRALLADGADLIDVGGESGITNRPAVVPEEEIARVVPVIERLAAQPDVLISVDTYKPAVAAAAIDAGAVMINDPSGLIDPGIADVCASTGAGLIVTHTRARPKEKLHRPHYDDVVADVLSLLSERMELARERGVADDQLMVCPGPDLGKDPPQTIELLRRLPEVVALGRPVLLAVSRKDFVGALTGTPPRERLAGTLAAIGHGLDAGVHVLRVHDVRAVRDYLTVRAALNGDLDVRDDLLLADELRREPPAAREAAA